MNKDNSNSTFMTERHLTPVENSAHAEQPTKTETIEY